MWPRRKEVRVQNFYRHHFSVKVELISNRPFWQMLDQLGLEPPAINIREKFFSDENCLHGIEALHPWMFESRAKNFQD